LRCRLVDTLLLWEQITTFQQVVTPKKDQVPQTIIDAPPRPRPHNSSSSSSSKARLPPPYSIRPPVMQNTFVR
jgi:hypothetical protein